MRENTSGWLDSAEIVGISNDIEVTNITQLSTETYVKNIRELRSVSAMFSSKNESHAPYNSHLKEMFRINGMLTS